MRPPAAMLYAPTATATRPRRARPTTTCALRSAALRQLSRTLGPLLDVQLASQDGTRAPYIRVQCLLNEASPDTQAVVVDVCCDPSNRVHVCLPEPQVDAHVAYSDDVFCGLPSIQSPAEASPATCTTRPACASVPAGQTAAHLTGAVMPPLRAARAATKRRPRRPAALPGQTQTAEPSVRRRLDRPRCMAAVPSMHLQPSRLGRQCVRRVRCGARHHPHRAGGQSHPVASPEAPSAAEQPDR